MRVLSCGRPVQSEQLPTRLEPTTPRCTLPLRFGRGRGHRKCQPREYRWLRWDDSFLSADQEPPRGAHLVTPRRGYVHHGIYIGSGMVVHYGGLAKGLRRGPVEECSLTAFAHGRGVWIRWGSLQRFKCEEIIRRARSRVGENQYRLLTNNCEHFCEWCLRGEARSEQVEYWFSRYQNILQWLASLLPLSRLRTA